jgi:hypothetical protein
MHLRAYTALGPLLLAFAVVSAVDPSAPILAALPLDLPVSAVNHALSSTRGSALLQAALANGTDKTRRVLMTGLEKLETQMNLGACAPASAVTVLNALGFDSPVDPVYNPFAFWTQASFIFGSCAKRFVGANVFGESLANFSAILSCMGLKTKTVFAQNEPSLVAAHIKQHLALGHHVIANFDRRLVHEEGSGHFSPVGCAEDGHMLILDVARYKYVRSGRARRGGGHTSTGSNRAPPHSRPCLCPRRTWWPPCFPRT